MFRDRIDGAIVDLAFTTNTEKKWKAKIEKVCGDDKYLVKFFRSSKKKAELVEVEECYDSEENDEVEY